MQPQKHNISRKRSYSPQSSTQPVADNGKSETTEKDPNEELTREEIAFEEGRHVNTVNNWLNPATKKKPQLQCVWRGGRLYITRSQVAAYHAACTALRLARKKSKKRGAK